MRVAIILLALAACSSDKKQPVVDASSHDGHLVDAGVDARHIDAAPILPDAPTDVRAVTCPASGFSDVTIIAAPQDPTGYSYSPKVTTIPVGGIVRFTTSGIHDVLPDGAPACAGCIADDGIHVPFSQVACRQFTVAAKYGFACSIHNFKGSVVVQ